MQEAAIGRVDFHLHSYASNVTDYYAANNLAIPESYSDPKELYKLLKERGMSLVTLTDHNSIDGVKELLDLGYRDVFISSEMTTTFPEDGCNIHVTVANMTEAQFAEVDRLRGNVYEMIDYVDQQIRSEGSQPAGNRLAYFMTHPLMSTQNRPYGREGALTVEHIEKALLLCNCIEVRNGTRTRSLNELTWRMVRGLDEETILRLAEKHGIAPKGPTPWLKAVVGGSDDHCGINPGRTWTQFPQPTKDSLEPNDLVDAMRARRTRPSGQHGGPVSLAHAVVKLLYDGEAQKERSTSSKSASLGGPLNSLLGYVFRSEALPLHQQLAFQAQALFKGKVRRALPRRRPGDKSFERILEEEAFALIARPAFRRELAAVEKTDDKIFLVVSSLINQILIRYVDRIQEAASLNVVRLIKEVVALVSSNLFVSLPYFLAYSNQSADHLMVRDVRKSFGLDEHNRLVLVTDTFFEVNGVARTIKRMIAEAEHREIDFCVITCLSAEEKKRRLQDPEIQELVESGRLKIFASVVNMKIPQYQELQVHIPPFLELLKYLQEEGFTKMQISTPGSLGVAGLMAAKLLSLDTSSTYHTSFPEYVENYTGDISLEALTWRYMIMFYHSVDEVVVPSRFIAKLLHKRGLRNRKLLILDRWVDLERFHPQKRRIGYWRTHGLVDEANLVKFIYVGRLGVEKNLKHLAEAYIELRETEPRAHLVLVGDGPYRAELEELLADVPTTFTGYLSGEELSQAIASADAKVFPSTTDTWGNAPLEAQASGLPVIVTDKGGPQELIKHGETGYRIAGRDQKQLLEAMRKLMDDGRRKAMGTAARHFTEEHAVTEPFSAILDAENYRKRATAMKHAVGGQPQDAKAEDLFELPRPEPELISAIFDTRQHGKRSPSPQDIHVDRG